MAGSSSILSPADLKYVHRTRNNGIARIVYAAVPLTYLNLSHLSIVGTIYQMSFIMAGLLVFYIGLALVVAKRFDQKNVKLDGEVEAA